MISWTVKSLFCTHWYVPASVLIMHDEPLLSCYNLMAAMAIIDEEIMEAIRLGSVSLYPVLNFFIATGDSIHFAIMALFQWCRFRPSMTIDTVVWTIYPIAQYLERRSSNEFIPKKIEATKIFIGSSHRSFLSCFLKHGTDQSGESGLGLVRGLDVFDDSMSQIRKKNI